jgi:hypothetical protein
MKNICNRYLVLLIISVLLFSCKKQKETTIPQPPAPPVTPVPSVLLKDLVMPSLPSPYYHFEYNAAGKITFASFASDFFRYDIVYNGDRISEVKNNIFMNKDRLQYSYDNSGRVSTIMYADSMGVAYKRISLAYDGQKLTSLVRELKSGVDFITEKTMTFTYHPDGNLLEITEHRPAINGQPASTVNDRFEQYDNKFNTDAFSLLHNEFFDHVVLLPGVRLQINNPGKQTRTGNGVNYQITYTYTYNDRKAPLTKNGAGVWTNGSNAGQTFLYNSVLSYY